MSDNPTKIFDELDKSEKKKLKPGQIKENRTFQDVKNAMRQSKTRVIRKIKNGVSKLRSLDSEPDEILVVIKDAKTNKFKIMGEGPMLQNLIDGKPLTTELPIKFKKHDTESIQSATKIRSDTYPFLKKKTNKEIRVHKEDSLEIAHSDKGNVSDIGHSLEEKDKHNQGDLLTQQNVCLGQHNLNSNDSSDKTDNAANCEIRNIFHADFSLEEMNKHQQWNLIENNDLDFGQKIFNSDDSSDTMNITENCYFSNISEADFSPEETKKHEQGNSIVKHDFVWGQNIFNSNDSSDEMHIVESERRNILDMLDTDFSLEEMKQIDKDNLLASIQPLEKK